MSSLIFFLFLILATMIFQIRSWDHNHQSGNVKSHVSSPPGPENSFPDLQFPPQLGSERREDPSPHAGCTTGQSTHGHNVWLCPDVQHITHTVCPTCSLHLMMMGCWSTRAEPSGSHSNISAPKEPLNPFANLGAFPARPSALMPRLQ